MPSTLTASIKKCGSCLLISALGLLFWGIAIICLVIFGANLLPLAIESLIIDWSLVIIAGIAIIALAIASAIAGIFLRLWATSSNAPP